MPTGQSKVGIARSPEDRARSLQTGNPFKITLEGSSQLSYFGVCPAEMERRIHALLEPYRMSGEWFDAPIERVHMAWKQAWLSLRHPEVIERWERMRERRAEAKAN